MATNKHNTSNVTRIRADGDTSPKKAKKPASVTSDTPVKASKSGFSPASLLKPFVALGRYFKGAWVELRQVRWPTRGATWSLTSAVLLFTVFFVILVLLLDAGFKYLFEQILG